MGNTICKGAMGTRELQKIATRLQELEWQLKNDWGLRNINGGFVRVYMFSFDDGYIDVEVMSGIQCGGEGDYSTTEQAKLDRQTLERVD